MTAPAIPPTLPAALASYLRSLVPYIDRELSRRPPQDSARDSVLLVSPNKSVYNVQVADDGTITTTLVSQG